MIAVSIISHAHGAMVSRLVGSLLACSEVAQVLVTLNLPEILELPADARVVVIQNRKPAGFGANHNAAFRHCTQPFFCVLNPDIQLESDPFSGLMAALVDSAAAVAAPLVLGLNREVEDSLRRFPTVRSLVSKAFGGQDGRYQAAAGGPVFQPDWVAGMFMLFRSAAFARLGGFDERYFLYYEDVDICARAWKAGLVIVACPWVQVIHDAQRHSRRNMRYMRWHLASMARFFWARYRDLPQRSELTGGRP